MKDEIHSDDPAAGYEHGVQYDRIAPKRNGTSAAGTEGKEDFPGRPQVGETADADYAREKVEYAYKKYANRLRATIQNMIGNPEISMDAAQGTFLKMLKHPSRHPAYGSFKGLWQSAKWLLIDKLRGEDAMLRLVDNPLAYDPDQDRVEWIYETAPGHEEDPHQVLEKKEAEVALESLLNGSLSKKQKKVILRRKLGFSFAEIADELGISVAAAKCLQLRAIKKLNGDL